MDTVTTIPSTSFLDSPLLHGTPISPNPSPSSTAKRSPAVVGAPLKLGISRVGATKPKQSKSRNGRQFWGRSSSSFGLAVAVWCAHSSPRLYYVQTKKVEM